MLDKEAQYFHQFAATLSNPTRFPARGNPQNYDALFSITQETQLLGEVKDISDELSILQMVLNDQLETLKEFAKIMQDKKGGSIEKSPAAIRIESISAQLHRLRKMEKLAEKTYNSVSTLPHSERKANKSSSIISLI